MGGLSKRIPVTYRTFLVATLAIAGAAHAAVTGSLGGDADVLAASAAFERLRPWGYEIPARRAI